MGPTRMAETQGASAFEQWSLAHSVHLLGQTGHMHSGHKGPVLLRLEVLLKKVGLLTHLGEGLADSLVLDHCRLHREWGQLGILVVHHSWIDDTLGRQAGAARMAAQVELTG